MIAELGILVSTVGVAWLAFDNWRLRNRLARLIGPVEPVNVLSNGVVLPEADDLRWTKRNARRYLQGPRSAAGLPTPMLGPEETMLVLGEIAVALHDRKVFISSSDVATRDEPKTKLYAEAVIVAHYSRRAMVSIEDGSSDGQV